MARPLAAEEAWGVGHRWRVEEGEVKNPAGYVGSHLSQPGLCPHHHRRPPQPPHPTQLHHDGIRAEHTE